MDRFFRVALGVVILLAILLLVGSAGAADNGAITSGQLGERVIGCLLIVWICSAGLYLLTEDGDMGRWE